MFGSAIRDLTTDRPTLTAAATVFGVAIIPAAVLLAIAGSNPAATAGSITALLYLGVVTTAVAYALWSAGLARLTLANTVTLTMLEPVAATVMAIAILGEPAGPTTILGIATTLAGVWIASTIPELAVRRHRTSSKGETVAPDPRHARPSRGPARAGCTLPAVSAILHEAVAVGNAGRPHRRPGGHGLIW